MPPRSRKSSYRYPRRRRRKLVVKWRRLVPSLLLTALVAEVAIALLTSPMFAVSGKHIAIIGNKLVPTSEVRHRLNLRPGTNIFRLPKRSMVNRVRGNPVVENVYIYRRLPNSIVARVIERKADIVLNTGHTLYEVDATGVPFRRVASPRSGLTVISCRVPGRVRLGKPIGSRSFEIARECLLLVRAKNIFRVADITVDQNDDLCLNVQDGFKVILGRPEQLSRKLDDAARPVREVPGFREHGEYVNVTCPGRPALKFKD